MIATPTMTPTFTANRMTTIAPSTPPTMATVTTLTPTTTLGDDDDGRPVRASLWCDTPHRGDFVVGLLTSETAAPPGGTFLALDNYCYDGGDAAGKARGMAEDGGGAYAGLDSLLMPPPPARLSDAPTAATATSSYSRSVVPHRRQNDDTIYARYCGERDVE